MVLRSVLKKVLIKKNSKLRSSAHEVKKKISPTNSKLLRLPKNPNDVSLTLLLTLLRIVKSSYVTLMTMLFHAKQG